MAIQDERDAATLGDQAVALAEQLGRIAGTIEGTAEGVLNRQRIADQLARVRDSASRMLQDLTARAQAKGPKVKKKPAKATRAAADPAHAPGKRRRKPGPTMHGVKKSDLAIPKARTAAAARQRRKSYA